jgi:hypothetical protein
MAITVALCKLQNVITIGSPLNGGLMEKTSPQAMLYLGGSLYPQQHQNLTYLIVMCGLSVPGGEA